MALEDIDEIEHYFYYNGYMTDYATATSKDFGKGMSNTITMINKWKNSEYGTQNSNDVWALIQEKVEQGWFVPSIEEWAAFAGNLEIKGKADSGEICLNGAAARKVQKGDKIIIVTYGQFEESELQNYKPTIVIVDDNNKIVEVK